MIAELLQRGQSNAIPLRHLEKITGLDGRSVRAQIELERRQGVPICSDNVTGYYLAANDSEKERFVASMRGRAFEILRTAAAVEAGRKIEG